ncbi:MAG: site-2 protease family protein, partial [Clostridia bacterium]|nr:site-2 protease family protein [Clostridia bacterium]
YKDECKIALAGPLINLLTALFFVSLWWFFPPVYAYTDVIVFASLSLAVINLLPCYPLDGGRFLYATLSLYIKRKKAKQIVSALGLALSVIFLVLFIISLFSTPNVTLFFFFLFMLLGVFGGSKKNTYVKTLSFLKEEYLKSPKIVKSIAISENALVKELFSLIDNAYYYEIKICSPNGTTTLNHKEMITLLTEESVYTKIANSKIYNELLLNNKKA